MPLLNQHSLAPDPAPDGEIVLLLSEKATFKVERLVWDAIYATQSWPDKETTDELKGTERCGMCDSGKQLRCGRYP